jgi:hypothetical protein
MQWTVPPLAAAVPVASADGLAGLTAAYGSDSD